MGRVGARTNAVGCEAVVASALPLAVGVGGAAVADVSDRAVFVAAARLAERAATCLAARLTGSVRLGVVGYRGVVADAL